MPKNEPDPQARELVAALREATRGLLYISETDAPFEPVHWPGESGTPEAGRLIELAGLKAGAPVKAQKLEEFFADLVREEDWFGELEKADARRYRELLELLRTRLPGARVFRLGRIQVTIFIVGRTPAGDWAGLRTSAVET